MDEKTRERDLLIYKREEIYDKLCRVLTNYEYEEYDETDLYYMLVEIQNNWDYIISAQ
jgi:hypothetical protein